MQKHDENSTVEIEQFIQAMLTLSGLKRGRDYIIRKSRLRIKKNPLRGKLLSTLKELYPEYSYYWETAQVLRWF